MRYRDNSMPIDARQSICAFSFAATVSGLFEESYL